MRHYQHLTLLERENILFLSATGYSITQIAKKMNRDKSTISREFNGLLREYFPKGKDLTTVRDEYIQQQINELNQRPRKCLGYRTPYEVYFSKMLHLV